MLGLILALALAAPQPGEYGVICFDPAVGGMKGTRVVLSGPAANPTVLFQYCNNWCSGHRTVSAKLAGETLDFQIASAAKAADTARFTGKFRGDILTLKGETASFPFKSGRLRRDQRCPRDTVKADP